MVHPLCLDVIHQSILTTCPSLENIRDNYLQAGAHHQWLLRRRQSFIVYAILKAYSVISP